MVRNLKNFLGDGKLNKVKIINQSKPDEIYNLAPQSHVGVSFDVAEYTAEVDGVGTLRILDAIRTCGLEKKIKFYQASTSEMYGKVAETPQNEKTPFHPRSPYGCAKLYSYWITVNYREAYGMFAINGILFNHESPRRGFNFVTKKITRGVAKIQLGLQVSLNLRGVPVRINFSLDPKFQSSLLSFSLSNHSHFRVKIDRMSHHLLRI